MNGIVIDVSEAEAYISMQDGTNICVGISHLPANIKAGSTVCIKPSSTQMTNHRINGLIL